MSYSRGEITHLVMPHMQNILGDLFGGDLMALVDQAAAVAAIRHAGGPAVTRSIHRLDFHRSIPVGALVTCSATVDFVGNSSMDITVEVYSEQVSSGAPRAHPQRARGVRGRGPEPQAQAGAAARGGDAGGAGALRAGAPLSRGGRSAK